VYAGERTPSTNGVVTGVVRRSFGTMTGLASAPECGRMSGEALTVSHTVQQRLLFSSLLLILLLSAESREGNRSVRGYVFATETPEMLVLNTGVRVQLPSPSAIVQDGKPYAGPVVVGLEVEARGRFQPPDRLHADRVTVLTRLDGKVEGTTVVDGRQDTPNQILLLADGRRLLWSPSRPLSAPSSAQATPLYKTASLQPGVMVEYRGRWTESGAVAVEELAAWRNQVEPKEKEIYEKYEPATVVPVNEDAGPPVLQVAKNRYQLLADSAVQSYIDRLGTRLLPPFWRQRGVAKEFGHSFWFAVVEHERIQASAFPGGVVAVHSQVFQVAENEAQLAFILAHEITHVLQEHPWREYRHKRGKLLFLRWSTAGLGYVVESAIRRGYQRELEAQADRLALSYMIQAGLDPREGLRLLAHLEDRQGGLSALFWETHRSYPQRRRALMQELARHSLAGLSYESLARDSSEFVGARSRISTAAPHRQKLAD
jgi:hypothetical protein